MGRNLDGRPSDLTIRRWKHFGESGAKLIWGGEAVAVRHDGRANPNQLLSTDETTGDLEMLREVLVEAHKSKFGSTDDLLIGLQLTHSGRFARPNHKKNLEPRILYHHPILDPKFGIEPDAACLSDTEIDDLIGDFVRASVRAREAGYAFVDIKHCHGYLGHEFLSAFSRHGRFGGSFENRTRFLRDIVAGVRCDSPGLAIGVRLSAFDLLPFKMGKDKTGEPESFEGTYPFAFGCDPAESARNRSLRDVPFSGPPRGPWNQARMHYGGKSLLQSSYSKTSAISAIGRLSPSGRSARWGGAIRLRLPQD